MSDYGSHRRGFLPAFMAVGLFFPGALLAAPTALNPQNSDIGVSSISFTWNDGGAPFTAALSTESDFSALTATGTVLTNSTTYISLDPNDIYYFRVKKQGESDTSYIVNTSTNGTFAAAPANPYFISENFTADSSITAQISLNWNTSGNPDWTDYEILYATNAGFSNSTTYAEPLPPVILGGLDANTTYFLKVRAVNLYGTQTVYTTAISSATMALELPSLSDLVYETSATISWTTISGPGQAQNSEGYRLILATSAIFDSLTTDWSTTVNTTSSKTLTGLTRNTIYYYQAGALNWNGAANFDYGSFATLPAGLQNLRLLDLSDQSVQLGWMALPASPPEASAAGYRLEASTASDLTGEILSSSTPNSQLSTLTVSGLEPNTTWYFRAASLNENSDANYTVTLSTITLTLPFSANTTATVPGPQSIKVVFTPLPASPQAFSCEGYRLEGSSAPFGAGSVVYSSETNLNQLNSLTLSELRPNTSYYLRLGTLTWNKTPNYTSLNTVKTSLPIPFDSVSLDLVWVTSAAVSFAGAGMGMDGYVVEASTHHNFNRIFASSATVNDNTSGLIVAGLEGNTVFYFRAGSLFNGTTVYINTTPSEQSTLAPPLTGRQINGVFYSSVTVGWASPASWPPDFTGDKYLLEASTSAGFQGLIFSSRSYIAQTAALSVEALTPNTSYYFRAGALNWDATPNFVNTPATSTLAGAPVQQTSNLTPSSIELNWLPNSNPDDTRYWVGLYADSGFTSFVSSATTILSSAAFYGLISNTTYYPVVTVFNRLNVPTGPVYFYPTATGAYDPGFDNYSYIGVSSLTVNWSSGTAAGGFNTQGTMYLAQISSDTAFSGAVLSSATTNLTASFTGLVSNASYYLQVSALNLTGELTYPPVSLGTALTLPATPYLLQPEQAFSDFLTDGFVVHWQDNGNSSHTLYSVEASTTSNFLIISTSVLLNATTCALSNLLIDTTYWVRIQAIGQSGLASPYVTAGSTKTLLYAQLNALASQDNTITLQASYGTITIFLPSGSLGSSTRMRLQPKIAFSPPVSAAATLNASNIGFEITYFPPTLLFKPVTITVSYRLPDLLLNLPGANRDRLILALYDETSGLWSPLPSVSDTAANRVIAQSWHLSTFQIMESASIAGLADVKIYPNPYRPSSVTNVMHFTKMPPYTKIKIYTFLGELVREIKADANGMATWAGDNNHGQKAASGVYIAYIQTENKKSDKIFKVVLER